ncbi:MAG: hypothetical protein HWE34_13170 [Methylocystaceae bacterium]|nr:hypothetical protein [Methylocystaceae bacterium]
MSPSKWAEFGEEPKLKDIMSDPIVALIMARDNLKANDVWEVVNKAKESFEKKAA